MKKDATAPVNEHGLVRIIVPVVGHLSTVYDWPSRRARETSNLTVSLEFDMTRRESTRVSEFWWFRVRNSL